MGQSWSKNEDSLSHSKRYGHAKDTATSYSIPLEKDIAKRQIEVNYQDMLTRHHGRKQEMSQIMKAIESGIIDPPTGRRIRKRQAMQELEYVHKKRTPMTSSQYEIIRKIGQGSFGQVYLVRHKSDRCLYAMKKLHKKDIIYKGQINHTWTERFVLASVGEHPLNVKMHCCFQDRDFLYFIMEYVPGGDMMTMLIRQQFLPAEWTRFYIAELVIAIDALHRNGIIHRDIKPDNILFRKNGHICLSDFGLSKSLMLSSDDPQFGKSSTNKQSAPNFIENIRRGNVNMSIDQRSSLWNMLARKTAFSQVGTPNYIAPEVLQDFCYSEACDWWSVGIILYQMLIGYPPFFSNNAIHVTSMICRWRQYLKFPDNLPESRLNNAAKDLICRLICEASSRLGSRKGISEFKAHPYFKGLDWDGLLSQQAPFIPDLESDVDTKYFDEDFTRIGNKESSWENSNVEPCSEKQLCSRPEHVPQNPLSLKSKRSRNKDLDFVGFTFIPMKVTRENPWEPNSSFSKLPQSTTGRDKGHIRREVSLKKNNVKLIDNPLPVSVQRSQSSDDLLEIQAVPRDSDIQALSTSEAITEIESPTKLSKSKSGRNHVRFLEEVMVEEFSVESYESDKIWESEYDESPFKAQSSKNYTKTGEVSTAH